MRVDASAKLNLSLRVLAREATGYHQIETVFCRIELSDRVEVTLADDAIELSLAADSSGAAPDLGPANKNLAVRAAAAFVERTGAAPGVKIRLLKRIPHGAGLGGGSSDAAAVLRALNTLHDAPLSEPELLELGAGIGSDVPFFLTGATLALGWGRGQRIAPLSALPQRDVLLAMPPERIPTGDAYAALSHLRGADYRASAAVIAPDIASWTDVARIAHNDFEDVVFQRLPLQRQLRNALADAGAIIARLTGTGSVVFGVFEDAAALERAREVVAGSFPAVTSIVTKTAV